MEKNIAGYEDKWIGLEAHFASFFQSEMVEIRIGPSGPHHDPYHRPPHHSRPMNKYEFITFFVMLALFIIIFIVAILSQPKTVPPSEPAELPHSGHVIAVKGKTQPAVNIIGTQPAPVPSPAPEPASEPSPSTPSSSPVSPSPAPSEPSATQPTSSAQPGDKIPDVKAIAASASEGNPLPVEEINNASKETFYGKFMHMR